MTTQAVIQIGYMMITQDVIQIGYMTHKSFCKLTTCKLQKNVTSAAPTHWSWMMSMHSVPSLYTLGWNTGA